MSSDEFPAVCPLCGAPMARDDEFYREFECGTDVSAFDASIISQDEPCKRRVEAQEQ